MDMLYEPLSTALVASIINSVVFGTSPTEAGYFGLSAAIGDEVGKLTQKYVLDKYAPSIAQSAGGVLKPALAGAGTYLVNYQIMPVVNGTQALPGAEAMVFGIGAVSAVGGSYVNDNFVRPYLH